MSTMHERQWATWSNTIITEILFIFQPAIRPHSTPTITKLTDLSEFISMYLAVCLSAYTHPYIVYVEHCSVVQFHFYFIWSLLLYSRIVIRYMQHRTQTNLKDSTEHIVHGNVLSSSSHSIETALMMGKCASTRPLIPSTRRKISFIDSQMIIIPCAPIDTVNCI